MKTRPNRCENTVGFILLVLAGLSLLRPAVCSAGPFTFLFRASVIVGGSPPCVAVADFDLDSNADFAEPVTTGSSVVLYLGKGNGRFQPGRAFPTGDYPYFLAVGDFDADGYPDLAIAHSGDIAILLNDRLGGFGAPIDLIANLSASSIAVGDFNNDDNADLAVVDAGADSVSILLGDGTGNFGLLATFPAGDQPTNLTVGDFNEDGNLDLAISTYLSQEIAILQGDGSGNLVYTHSYPLIGNGAEILTGDFNNDQHLDLAVGYYNSGSNVVTFLGDGQGSFTSAGALQVGDVHGITAADFNLDGNLDLAAATYFGEGIMIGIGDGTGNFAHAQKIHLPGRGPLPNDVAAADFDGDGRPDFVTANFGTSTASVFINRPD